MPPVQESQQSAPLTTAQKVFDAIAAIPQTRKKNGLSPLPFGALEIDHFEGVARARTVFDYLEGPANFAYKEEIIATVGGNEEFRVETTLVTPFNPDPLPHPPQIENALATRRIQDILAELEKAA